MLALATCLLLLTGETIQESWTESHLSALMARYRDLHAAPELSLAEEQTAQRLVATLRGLAIETTEKVGGTGVVGVLRNGDGPTVLVRTDTDALPVTEETGLPFASRVRVRKEGGEEVGVMHACGHDIHMTVWSGVAAFFAEHRELWSGTLVFVAQPAEEIGAGAKAMISDGLFERFPRPDYTLALHVSADRPAGTIGFTSGWAMANVDSVDILVRGRGGHGSAPQTTHDPVALAARIVVGLQTIVSREVDPREPAVVTVGSIHGGTKHNIIPNEVRLQLTVRSYTDQVRKQLLGGIERVAANEARAAGFPEDLLPIVNTSADEFTPACWNDPSLVQRANTAIRSVLGPDSVVAVSPSMGGEDFGRYARTADVPGYMFGLGAVDPERWLAAQAEGAPPLPSLHTSTFAPDAGLAIRTGVVAMTSAVLALLGSG